MRKHDPAFTILEIMVVLALLGLLTAIIVPHVLKARNRSDQKVCINNLREIDQAIQIWAAETKAKPRGRVTHTNLIPYLRKLPTCPAVKGGTFFSDYGMTYVEEDSYCVANSSLASTPHSLTGPAAAIAVGDTRRNSVAAENFPKPRKNTSH